MKRDEDLTMLRECYRMGHGIDFCWGRSMVLEDCADIPLNALKRLCAVWKANLNEVQQGIDYQRAIFQAAAMLVNAKGGRKARTFTDGYGVERRARGPMWRGTAGE